MKKTVTTIILSFFLFISCGSDNNGNNGNENGNGNPPAPEEIIPDEGITLYGLVADDKGNPVRDVVVTDGYSCVTTDEKGVYQIVKHASAVYAYISVPSGYEIPRQKGYGTYPDFYKSALSVSGDASKPVRADFTLTPRPGPDNDFVLFAVGDPQPDSDIHAGYFKDETIADMKKEAAAYSQPKVAIALGDIIGNNETGNRFALMKSHMGTSGFPFFVAIGNHDKSEGGGDYGEKFRANFGPLYYSFNIGDAHFIALDDIIFEKPGTGQEYVLGVTDQQVEWMEKDLGFVPEDKLIIVYYHIPMRNNTGNKNIKKVMDLLEPYENVATMSAHTHYFQPYQNTTHGIFERIHGAACGYFWRSRVAGDGVPNGYAIYEVSGNKIVNSRFKATNRDKDHQIRLYRGNGTYDGGYFFDMGENHIIANVFFAGMDGAAWDIEVYENGVYSGKMQQVPGSYGDSWIRGYHRGVLNYGTSALCNCNHLFSYRLKDSSAEVMVKATDRYGNIYTQDKFTVGRDYSEAAGY